MHRRRYNVHSSTTSSHRGVRSVPLETPGIQHCSGNNGAHRLPDVGSRWTHPSHTPSPTVFDYPSVADEQVHLSFLIAAAPRQIMIALISFDSRFATSLPMYDTRRSRAPRECGAGVALKDKLHSNLAPVIGIDDSLTDEFRYGRLVRAWYFFDTVVKYWGGTTILSTQLLFRFCEN